MVSDGLATGGDKVVSRVAGIIGDVGAAAIR